MMTTYLQTKQHFVLLLNKTQILKNQCDLKYFADERIINNTTFPNLWEKANVILGEKNLAFSIDFRREERPTFFKSL